MTDIIKIIIADDHRIFRTGLKFILDGISNYKVVAEAIDGKDLLLCLHNHDADIIFMDIKMPNMDGMETTRQIRSKNPKIGIIALSMFSEIEYFTRMMEAGADGFLLKNAQPAELKEAINMVMSGEKYFAKEFMQMVPEKSKKNKVVVKLSEREKEVLQLICQGESTNDIAEKLHLSSHTIEGHRKNIMLKTDCNNTASLVAFTVKNNIVDI